MNPLISKACAASGKSLARFVKEAHPKKTVEERALIELGCRNHDEITEEMEDLAYFLLKLSDK